MIAMVLAAAGFCGLVLAALAASLMTLLRSRALEVAAQRRAKAIEHHYGSVLDIMHQRLESLTQRIEQVRAVPPPAAPALARHGLNLSRRSEALRRHRRGESTRQIAAQLEIPLQEVELLLKIHEIVMSTI
jgi:hypothetical protein